MPQCVDGEVPQCGDGTRCADGEVPRCADGEVPRCADAAVPQSAAVRLGVAPYAAEARLSAAQNAEQVLRAVADLRGLA